MNIIFMSKIGKGKGNSMYKKNLTNLSNDIAINYLQYKKE